MTKRLNSKHKVDRRLKVNLWGRPKSPFNKRAYGPGQHGQTKTSKPYDYGIQLQAKQKLKAYYGNINERQFRNIYKKAVMLKGDTGENLIGLLERRLDAVIYRAKFATTIFSARPIAKPDIIQWAPNLPKTRSGKIMRRILRKVACNEEESIGDTSTLNEPEVVQELINNRQ